MLLYNLGRVHDLWPLLLDHIVELLSDSKSSIRTAAVDALGRALTGALAACVSAPAQVPRISASPLTTESSFQGSGPSTAPIHSPQRPLFMRVQNSCKR